MACRKSKNQLIKHKEYALKKLDAYLSSQINSGNPDSEDRADKLSYWIADYANFLKKEVTYDPTKGIRYKRGDIVKAHLGFRLGSEEGGLHFGVVLDVDNSKKSDTITIVPLTSQKDNKKIHPNSVELGFEIFRTVVSKHDKLQKELISRLNKCHATLVAYKENPDTPVDSEKMQSIFEEINLLEGKLNELKEIKKSVLKMKNGSIALVNQIVTISKMRIYDPVYSSNVLYGIRLSSTTLGLIDQKIAELYLGKGK